MTCKIGIRKKKGKFTVISQTLVVGIQHIHSWHPFSVPANFSFVFSHGFHSQSEEARVLFILLLFFNVTNTHNIKSNLINNLKITLQKSMKTYNLNRNSAALMQTFCTYFLCRKCTVRIILKWKTYNMNNLCSINLERSVLYFGVSLF